MLPQSLLLYSLLPGSSVSLDGRRARATLLPGYFTERDHPWVSRFHAEFLRFKGKRRREALAFFQGPLPFPAPERKRALLLHWLLRQSDGDGETGAGKAARRLRAAVFECCAAFPAKPPATAVLAHPDLAASLPGGPEALRENLFLDLPLERRLIRVPESLTPGHIALSVNLTLAQGLVARSSAVEIRAEGEIRRIVRQAKLRRLICQPGAVDGKNDSALLRISGPLSLFGHTTVYGHALAELIPLLSWCNRFGLSAICRIRGRDAAFRLRSGDPILPSAEPRHFDSQLEERFAREFTAAAPDWDLIREPEPISSGSSIGTLIFPDFVIRHRRAPELTFPVEIVGYWTRDYLLKKIDSLRAAKLGHLILCVDESLDCDGSQERSALESLGELVLFRRRIPVDRVLSLIERRPAMAS